MPNHGQWRSPAQFQLTLRGVRNGAAQAIAPMVIEPKNDGEVVDVISSSSCSLSGLATQFVAEYVERSAREAKLNLNALDMRLPNGKFRQTSAEAVLRR